MTIYKRIGSFILSLLLVFSMFGSTFAIQTFAATSPALSAESKTVNAGEQFTVAVSLANATTVYGGNFTLQYDSSLLTADSYEFSSIVSGHTKNCNLNYQSAGNLIRVTFSGASAVTASGTLITFTFTAKENVSGSAALQFNAYKMYDENGSAISSTATGSTITISSGPIVTPAISVTSKTVTVGDTVSVPVVITNSSEVYGGNFTLQYDSTLLTADSYSFGNIVSGHTKNCNLNYQSAGNLIRVTFSGADAVSSDGILVTFTFTAKATGTAVLQFNAYKMYDENGTSIDTTVSDGNVTIGPKPNTDTTNPTGSISSTNNLAIYQTLTLTMTDNLGVKSYYFGTSSSPSSSSFTSITSTTYTTAERTVSSPGTYYLIVKDAAGNTSTTSETFYKTTLNANGGSLPINYIITKSGNSITVPAPTNSDSSMTFVGWGTSASATSGVKTITVSSSKTYYAIWESSNIVSGQCGDNLTYSYDTTIHTLTITGEGDMWNWTLDELPPWDEFKETIRHIKVESGVTTIGSRAFPKCAALESVELPNSIVTIGNIAFAGCTALTDITLPYGVSSLGNSVFVQCTNLKTFTFPSTITSIGDFVFQNCTNLKTVTIENGITNIGEFVFQDCTSLENVKLPDSVTSIGGHIFAGCTSLTSATIGAGLTKISAWAFWGCSELETVNFLGNIVDIGSHAFYECIKLKNIEIPARVTSIGECAFEGCSAIENAKIPSSATSVGSWAFKNCIALESLTIENGVTDINQGTFLGCTGLVNVEIPGSVNNMGHYAFAGCSNLMNIAILNDQISIASTTFSDCEELVLYGHNESTTEIYANENGIPFVEIGNIRIDSVSIKTTPTKATYYIGDSLSTSGLKLLVRYSDGSTETITSGFTTSGFSSTSAGTKTVTVSYEGFTVTFTVTVKTPSITLSSSSKSMTVGDSTTITATTTPSDQTVVWTSSNTSVATVSGGIITAKASGSTTITAKFTYNGKTYSKTCSVTVEDVPVPPTPTSLSVSTKPTKTTYEIGESLNTSGLKLKLTYSDGSTETITSGFTTSGFSSTTAGTKTVTVKYSGLTTTFTVTVNENVPVHDACVYTEAKKTVVQGSQFTYTVSLAGTYDGFSFEIASGNGLTVTDIVTTNSNINIDEIGDKWMVSVLGGLAKTDAEKEELVTVTVQVASDAELGARTLTLSNLMLSNESGDKVSAIKYEYASIEITDQIPGDINGDGTFDYYDVSKLYAYYRNKTALSESVDTDVNGDGGFDYYDVSKLYAIYRGKANFN